MPIPPFIDGYYLPEGEHTCSLEEARKRFADGSPRRQYVWRCFERVMSMLLEVGLIPEILLIDGSFVTAKDDPGDVDFACLIPPETARRAFREASDSKKAAILAFMNPRNQAAIRDPWGSFPGSP